MDSLCRALLEEGTLDERGLELVQAHVAAHGGTLDDGLLELDLVDEESLLAALARSGGAPVARPADLAAAEPAVAARLPLAAADAFRMCPLRLEAGGVVALVPRRLPERWAQELRDLFALPVTQLLAPAHYVAVARHAVYGVPLEARARTLERRLSQRRQAESPAAVVAALARAATLGDAAAVLLDHGARLLEFCCLLRPEADAARPWLVRRGGACSRPQAPLPVDAGCAFAAAVLHGGYFLGPVGDAPAHRRFFAALERKPPRMAFVAPAPGTGAPALVFYGDNGARAIASRWVAELSLLAARLGQWHAAPAAGRTARTAAPRRAAADEGALAAAEVAAPGVTAESVVAGATVSAADLAVLARLRAAAAAAGLAPAELLERLLAGRRADLDPGDVAAPGAEVKGLIQQLATDLPTQLARGVEHAFREMMLRLGPAAGVGAPPAAGAGAPAAVAPARLPGGAGLIVTTPASGVRDVPDYRARRRKIEPTRF